MIKEKTWEEFRASGLLFLVNQLLHAFGYAIVVDVDADGSVNKAYPARVKFHGFSEDVVENGYKQISQYVDKNSKELLQEASD